MFQTEYSLVTYTMDQKVKAALRQADNWRTRREASKGHRPGIARWIHRWLYRLGQAMVVLGQRLEHHSAAMKDHHSASQSQSARV